MGEEKKHLEGRRDFLNDVTKGLGQIFTSPTVSVVATALGLQTENGTTAVSSYKFFQQLPDLDTETSLIQKNGFLISSRTIVAEFLRTGTPVNIKGEPLGPDLQAPSVVQRPEYAATKRYSVFVPHGKASEEYPAGLSSFEIDEVSNGKWGLPDLVIESLRNRRLNSVSDIIDDDGIGDGKSQVTSLCSSKPTPWNTFVALDENGFMVEYNPVTGASFRRKKLGRLPGAVSLAISFTEGRRLKSMLAGCGLYRVVSRQFYAARYPQANLNILSSGEGYVADFKDNLWKRIILNDETEVNGPEFCSIAASADTNIFYLACLDGKLHRLKDRGDKFELSSFAGPEGVTQIRYMNGVIFTVSKRPGGLWVIHSCDEKTMKWKEVLLWKGKEEDVLKISNPWVTDKGKIFLFIVTPVEHKLQSKLWIAQLS